MSKPFHDLLASATEGDYINAGWIPPEKRDSKQSTLIEQLSDEIPRLQIIGPQADVEKLVLWDFSKKINNGNHFRTFYQQTGSCVGAGGGQAIWYLAAMEAVRLQQNEDVKIPFWLLPYGRSRYYAGFGGSGEGSSGAAFAKAIKEDGTLPFDYQDLPQPRDTNGLNWGSNVEYTWSNGRRISEKYLNESKKFVVRSTALCSSSSDVWDAIANGYPCTEASSWGGRMRPAKAGGSVPVLLNSHASRWDHQMCIIGIWKHPSLGKIYLVLNSWGTDAHGAPADDSPPGSFWVLEQDIDYMCRGREVFAFSQFDGFPAQRPNHFLI